MPDFSIDQTMQLALRHHQAGHLQQAETLYRSILAHAPDDIDALNLLGRLFIEIGQYSAAFELLQRVTSLAPNFAEGHFNPGCALHSQGDMNRAIQSYQHTITLNPAMAQAHANLGSIHLKLKQFDEAIACFQQAIKFAPDAAELHYDLATAQMAQSKFQEAAASLQAAISLKQDYADAYMMLGNVLASLEQYAPAANCFQRTISLKPNFPQGYNNLGNIRVLQALPDQAIICFQKAIELDPALADAHYNLGNVLASQGKMEAAVASFEKTTQLDPTNADAHNNLGILLKDLGEIDLALTSFRRAVDSMPAFHAAHSNILLVSHYNSQLSPPEIYDLHRQWDQQHAAPLRRFIQQHKNDRSPDRPLRIGYVSPDFRQHSVAYFALPLMESHDRDRFHLTCYQTNVKADSITERFRSIAHQWRNISELNDEQACELIRRDEIDILVDLAGHTSLNRLLIFARKPAPVQVTWLGYPNTTGMDAIDYRFTDEKADPLHITDQLCSEKLVRLPDTAWCYAPLSGSPVIHPPPALANGFITFGSFNAHAKLSTPLLKMWGDLLHAVPTARLLIKNSSTSSEMVKKSLQHTLADMDISSSRLQLVAPEESSQKHLEWYNQVDIALDSFPYHGTTTTCEASWMGVPIVTLAGPSHVSRVGVSLLSSIGLNDLISHSKADYIRIASTLAGDLPRLTEIRSNLRQQMQQSPLMNAACFAGNVESAYHRMWRTWCADRVELNGI